MPGEMTNERMSVFEKWWAALPLEQREHASFQERAWNASRAHVLAEIRRQMGWTATIENPHSLAGKWLEGHDSMHLYVNGILDSLEKSI